MEVDSSSDSAPSVPEVLEAATKLCKRLRSSIEEDARLLRFGDLLRDAQALQKKFRMLRSVSVPLTALPEPQRLRARVFELLESFRGHLSKCGLRVLAGERRFPVDDSGCMLGLEDWRAMQESLAAAVLWLKALLVDGSASLVRSVRARVVALLDAVDEVLQALLGYRARAPGRTVGRLEEMAEMQKMEKAVQELNRMPLTDVEANLVDLEEARGIVRRKMRDIRIIGRSKYSMISDDDLSSEEQEEEQQQLQEHDAEKNGMGEEVMGVADQVVVVEAYRMTNLAQMLIKDVAVFIKKQYQFEQNLSWMCYGVPWLENTNRISRSISIQVEELALALAPPQNFSSIARNVRLLRVHLKALIDIAVGHDQFQECEITSSKEIFKSGYYWSHKMTKRLHSSFDALMVQLYRQGV